jgi:hypothetical protein
LAVFLGCNGCFRPDPQALFAAQHFLDGSQFIFLFQNVWELCVAAGLYAVVQLPHWLGCP